MEVWTTIGNSLLRLAAILDKLKTDKRKQKEDIQKAISTAFHNTEKYYAFLDAGNARNREREYDLGKDWEHAAILVESVDKELANRLGLKGSYWRDGGTWSEQQIGEVGIQLERVRTEGMSLFFKKDEKEVIIGDLFIVSRHQQYCF